MKLEKNLMLTDWFPPDVKPVRSGVYEVKLDKRYNKGKGFAYWCNELKKWTNMVQLADRAAQRSDWFEGADQDKYWRGLAKKP
jgi:putative component of toxin-antitoxin plasmid stabilization module